MIFWILIFVVLIAMGINHTIDVAMARKRSYYPGFVLYFWLRTLLLLLLIVGFFSHHILRIL